MLLRRRLVVESQKCGVIFRYKQKSYRILLYYSNFGITDLLNLLISTEVITIQHINIGIQHVEVYSYPQHCE